MEGELLSEYFGQDGSRKAEVIKEGKWYIAKLMQGGKIMTHVSTFKEAEAENAAEDWVNDTV